MRFIISSLILALALYFLLKGCNYKNYFYNLQLPQSENFNVQNELVKSVECKEPPVVEANKFVDDKNDSNFQSNILNVNRFYKKNINDTPEIITNKSNETNVNLFKNVSKYSNQPTTWNYKNELVMNGGELLSGITGYDNLIDQYFTYGKTSLNSDSCNPPTRGSMTNDDLRMGLGSINATRRSIT